MLNHGITGYDEYSNDDDDYNLDDYHDYHDHNDDYNVDDESYC